MPPFPLSSCGQPYPSARQPSFEDTGNVIGCYLKRHPHMTDDHALAADSGLRRMQHPVCFLGKEPPDKAYLRIYADNKECWCSGLSATNQYQLHCVPPLV